MVPLERAMAVSYNKAPHRDHCAISDHSTAMRNLPSNVCDAQINKGWVTSAQNFRVFSLEQKRDLESAESEHSRITNREIIFEDFQPMWSQYLNVTCERRDRQTICRMRIGSRRKNTLCEFGQLILRKILKITTTRCHILRLRCAKYDFGWGSSDDAKPHWESLQRSPDPLAGFGPYF